MANFNLNALTVELNQTKDDCFENLNNITKIEEELRDTLRNSLLASEFRKTAIPMVYAAWESHFTSSISICFRAIKDVDKAASFHSPTVRAVWLQQESFFTSYIDMIKNIYDIDAHKTLNEKMANMKKKVRKGHFKLTSEVLKGLDSFNTKNLNSDVNSDDLVMTFSNVNRVVTEMNMEVIGLNVSRLDLSNLDELVGLRNALGHGQFKTTIGQRKFLQLVEYTKDLIVNLQKIIIDWLIELNKEVKSSKISAWSCHDHTNISFRYSL